MRWRVAGALTAIAGSSEVFEYGFVTYANAAKTRLLGVSPDILGAHGAVSEATARAMAEGARAASGADLAVAVMAPIGAEMRRMLADPAGIDRVLTAGAEKAREVAAPTLAEVKKIVGYWAG